MKRRLTLLLLVSLISAGRLWATPVSEICASNPVNPPPTTVGRECSMIAGVVLNATATITSGCIDLSRSERIGVEYQCNDAGTVKYDLIWRTGSACDTDNLTDDFTVAVDSTSKAVLHAPVFPSPGLKGQAVLTGKSGNAATTTCTIKSFLK